MKKKIVLISLLVIISLVLGGCDLFNKIKKLQEESFPEVEEIDYNEKELVCDFTNSIISDYLKAHSTIEFYFDNNGNATSATYKDEFSKEDSNIELYESFKNNCNNQNCTALYQNEQLLIEGILDTDYLTMKNWNNKNKKELKEIIENNYADILNNCK